MPGLRAGDGAGAEPASIVARLGWWCFETTTPLTEGTYEAARSAVDCRARRRPTPCSAASASPTGCAGRPVTTPRRRCTAATASSTTRRSPPHHVAADDRRSRSPCSTSTTTTATARSRSSTSATTSQFVSLHGDPARAYPYLTGFADETGAGRGSGSHVQRPARRRHRRRRLPRRAGAGAGGDRRVRARRRSSSRSGVDTLRRRPDLRPGAHDRGLRPLRRGRRRARPPDWSCCRRAATPTTPSAPTSARWLLGASGV